MFDIRRFATLLLIALGSLWIVAAALSVRGSGDDWVLFLKAGHYVGSPKLLDVAQFVYMPGAAWTLWPFAHLSRDTSYFVYAALSLVLAIGAASIAASVYGLSRATAILMTLLWWPLTIALCLGQNACLGLFLVTVVVLAMARRSELLCGVAVGLLLYKPTIALPLLLLIVVFRLWRAAGIVALCGALWYFVSASAVGEWLWVKPYLHTVSALYDMDRVLDGDFAIGLPGVLIHLGMSPLAGWLLGIALLLASLFVFVRVRPVEAATMAPAIGLATTPHAYGYDALLLLPALWYAAASRNRFRMPALVGIYCLAPFYLLSRRLHFDALAIDVVVIAAAWVLWRVGTILRGDAAKEGEMAHGALFPREVAGARDARTT